VDRIPLGVSIMSSQFFLLVMAVEAKFRSGESLAKQFYLWPGVMRVMATGTLNLFIEKRNYPYE
jgi:hypothetical protein